jgi:hypothetical protein
MTDFGDFRTGLTLREGKKTEEGGSQRVDLFVDNY